MCRNPKDYNNCLDLTSEKLNCINNGECKEIAINECRGINNSSYICTSLMDGWCKDQATNSCLDPIPNNFCRDQTSSLCANIQLD